MARFTRVFRNADTAGEVRQRLRFRLTLELRVLLHAAAGGSVSFYRQILQTQLDSDHEGKRSGKSGARRKGILRYRERRAGLEHGPDDAEAVERNASAPLSDRGRATGNAWITLGNLRLHRLRLSESRGYGATNRSSRRPDHTSGMPHADSKPAIRGQGLDRSTSSRYFWRSAARSMETNDGGQRYARYFLFCLRAGLTVGPVGMGVMSGRALRPLNWWRRRRRRSRARICRCRFRCAARATSWTI